MVFGIYELFHQLILAKEIISEAGEKLHEIEMGQLTMEQGISILMERSEKVASKLGIDQSRIQQLRDAAKGLGKDLSKRGVGDALWFVAKTSLRLLGIPIP